MERELRKEFSTRHLFIWTIIIVLTFILSILIYLDTNSFGDEILLSPDILVSSCQELNITGETYVLQNDLNAVGNCFNISADNLIFDGQNHILTGNGSGFGIFSTGRNLISIKNVQLNNFSNDVYLEYVSNYSLININSFDDFSSFLGNNITITNSSFRGNLNIGGLSDVSFVDNYLTAYSFSSISSNSPSINFIAIGKGKIDFIPSISTSGTNLSSDVRISNNYVYVNSSNSGLNKSAEITLYGLATNMNQPRILKDGIVCGSPSCVNLTSLNAGTVVFNVTGFSNYTIIDANPLQVIDVNEPRNKTYRNGDFPLKLDVDLSEAGSVWFKLDNGTNVSMNTTNNLNFNYSLSIPSYGSHYFQAFANDSAGLDYVYSDIVYFSVSNSSGSSGGAGSSGSGGSSGYSVTGWTSSTNIDYSLINSSTGYSVDLDQKSRITFNFGSFQEFVGVVNVSGPSALIETSGDPVRQNILVGEAYNFDLNDDGPSDIEVRLETINNNKVSLRIKDISQSAVITSQVIPNSQEVDAGAAEEKIRTSAKIFWGVFALFGSILLVAIVYVVINLIKKKETEANLTLQS